MIVAVASGKGGTGKTTIAVNLARTAGAPVQLLDCDVEEPNDHLFLSGNLEQTEIVNIPIPEVDEDLCNGCGECVAVCPAEAIPVNWETAAEPLLEKSAEYVKAILANKGGRAAFFNFLLRMSPECDCYEWNDAPFVADIGIVASRDPVAIDQASTDLVNAGQVLSSSRLKGKNPDGDAITAATGVKGWRRILEYAEEIGVGTRSYELVRIGGKRT